jgi:hypothetical protein
MIAASHSTFGVVFKILAVFVFAVAAVVQGVKRARDRASRESALRNLTAQLGFDDFNPDRYESFAQAWGFLSRLKQGTNGYAFNVLRGTYHGQSLFVFDHHYQTGSGKNREDHYGTVLMLVWKEIFSQVTIGPESLSAKIAAAFGVGDEIKFESAEFSRKFCVRSEDKRFAYDVCNPRMIEYLLANSGLQVEIQGPVLLLAFEPQLPVGQIEANLGRLIEIRSLLPEYLFKQ